MHYDAEGTRTGKLEFDRNGKPTKVIHYLIDGSYADAKTVQEVITEGVATSTTNFVWGNGLLEHLRNGEATFYHADGLGSIKALSDSAGVVKDSFQYEAFGALQKHSGATGSGYRYTAEHYDEQVGLQYNRARFYDPSTGRFISNDKFSGYLKQPLSLNKYIYTNADPINNTDPSGFMQLPELLSANKVEGEMETVSVNTGKSYLRNVGCKMVTWAANEAVNEGIYILISESGSFYVGQSTDIGRRQLEHARDAAKKGFKLLVKVAVPLLGGQAGKDIMRIAEQAVMDAIKDQGGTLTNRFRAVSERVRMFKPLSEIQAMCK